MKLKPQVLGYERQRRVLGGADLVSWEVVEGIPLLIDHIIGQRAIEIESAIGVLVFQFIIAHHIVEVLLLVVLVGFLAPRGSLFLLIALDKSFPLGTPSSNSKTSCSPSRPLRHGWFSLTIAIGDGSVGMQRVGHFRPGVGSAWKYSGSGQQARSICCRQPRWY